MWNPFKSSDDRTGLVIVFVFIAYLSLPILAIVGQVKCVVKAVQCNWEPIGKAEVIYTAAACTGAGAIVGWINIEDK